VTSGAIVVAIGSAGISSGVAGGPGAVAHALIVEITARPSAGSRPGLSELSIVSIASRCDVDGLPIAGCVEAPLQSPVRNLPCQE
jgi:hypothetical protein